MRHRFAFRDRLRDQQLELRIADSIGTHPMLWGAMITIEAQHGIVVLSGVVRTPLHRPLVDLLARKMGALGVDNRLRVGSDPGAHDRMEKVTAE